MMEAAFPEEEVLWKVLWKMKVPPKVRHFTWRLLKHILPTKSLLFTRKISPSGLCPLCSNGMESLDHLFCDCPWLVSFWSSTGLSLNPQQQTGEHKIIQWLQELAANRKYEDLNLAVVLLWLIWGARNAAVFNGERCQVDALLQRGRLYVAQYQQVQQYNVAQIQHRSIKWFPPGDGNYKVNCDGCLKLDGKAGIGIIVRDHNGVVMGAMSKPCSSIVSVKEVECLAIRDALEFAQAASFRRIILESDAEGVVNEINRGRHSYTLHGHIVEDIHSLRMQFDYCSISFAPRSCNNVADRLANVGAYSEHERIWLEDTPDCIIDVLIDDA